jgi:protease-4
MKISRFSVLFLVGLCGCMSVDLGSLFSSSLEEVVIDKGKSFSRQKIALVDVSGVMAAQPGGWLGGMSCTPDGMAAVLRHLAEDKQVAAVVVRIDSPGGGVTASETIYHELLRYKKEAGVPVVVSMQGLACSGGYYVAMAADELYATPTTVTGSIGVIARLPNLSGLADKVGYREEIITSGNMKAMGHPLKEMRAEEREVFQRMINSMYDRFVSVVANGRPKLSQSKIQELADGRIYTGQEAADLGLIDGIDHLPEVIERAKVLADAPGAKVVSWLPGGAADPSLYAASGQRPVVRLPSVGAGTAGFYYLWLP